MLDAFDKIALFALTVAISYLSWRFVEHPFRSGSLAPTRRNAFRVAGMHGRVGHIPAKLTRAEVADGRIIIAGGNTCMDMTRAGATCVICHFPGTGFGRRDLKLFERARDRRFRKN